MIYDNNYTSSLFPIYLSPHFGALVGYLLLKGYRSEKITEDAYKEVDGV